jgi:SAM-dependent methyltransferase
MRSLSANKTPFVPIPKNILPEIIQALNLSTDSIFYDLGCGDGRILQAGLRLKPQIKTIGIEKEILPFYLAKWRLRKAIAAGSCQVFHQSFFNQSLTKATHVFTYLFPDLMDELLPKLQQELKPGTKLVSCDFAFNTKQPVKIIHLKRANRSLGQKLYCYEF